MVEEAETEEAEVAAVAVAEAMPEEEGLCPVLQLACTKGSGMNIMRSTMLLE